MNVKIAEKGENQRYWGMNRALKHFDRFDVGSKKYWAIFFGQKQTKRYKVSSFASRILAFLQVKIDEIEPCSILNALTLARKSVKLYSLIENKANGTNWVGPPFPRRLYAREN